MKRVQYQATARRKDAPDASYTVWDYSPDEAVARVLLWEGAEQAASYWVLLEDMTTGTTVRYDGADYLVEGEIGTPCAECGGPCDSVDSVATDAGLAFCGSYRGNGCADKVA